ncbi:GNAT family N-acetyltransferase [bacterium]|nr:GNAT family N-acetyltransferase [bacterium]
MTVSRAVAEDAPAVHAIALQNAYENLEDPQKGFLVGGKPLEFYQLAIEAGVVYVAREDGVLVGFTLVCDLQSRFAEGDLEEVHRGRLWDTVSQAPNLKWFVQTAVTRERLHRGYGWALVNHVFELFPKSSFGGSIVEEWALPGKTLSNAASVAFRKKQGFQRIGGLMYPYKASPMMVGIYLKPAPANP